MQGSMTVQLCTQGKNLADAENCNGRPQGRFLSGSFEDVVLFSS